MDDVGTPIDPDVLTGPRYTALDFLIGLSLVLGASILNALGLNLAKRDHLEAAKLARAQRSTFRLMGVLGMGLYILSQLIGSSLALQYLRAQYVAPLSSSSLIANLPLARWLCGTSITRLDLIGTAVVILGVCGVVGFSNIKQAGSIDEETALDLSSLQRLWGRGGWIGFFIVLEVTSLLVLWVAHILSDVLREREQLEPARLDEADRIMAQRREARSEAGLWRRLVLKQRIYRKLLKGRIEQILHSRSDISVRKWSALLWSISGGLLSGQTLVYAKETLKLASNGEASQFASPLPVIIIVLLACTAVAQIICLNKGLAAYDSTLVVPAFFAVYAGTSFLTSLIALDQTDSYSTAILTLISISLLILTAGVVVLSSKKPEAPPKINTDEEADAVELDSKRVGRTDGLLATETVWEVGEDSLEAEELEHGDDKRPRYLPVEEDDDFGELQSPVER